MTRSIAVLFLFTFLTNIANAANDWTQMSPSSSPSARYTHTVAYIGGDQVLLFGGYDDNGLDDETWVYDLSANTWAQQSPSSKPSTRYNHGMAHIGGDQILLFGGNDGDLVDDTWVYDLSAVTWTQQSPSSKPSAREYHDMAYIGGDQVLLFGGLGYGDTWIYDLSENTWIQQSPASNPSARYVHAMAYIGGDRVLLFGGFDENIDDETWVYDLSANTWTQQFPASNPSARECHAMAHIGGDQVLLFGGSSGGDETWVYDLSANTWVQDTNTTQPSARTYHALSETSMEGSSCPVLFGGVDSGFNYDDETWVFGNGDYLFPFEAMVLGIELIGANTGRISWSAITGATDYDLYRSSTAFFSGSGSPWQIVATPTTQLDFSDGIGDTNTNYYFLGKARSATQTSPASNIVGEFDVALP